MTKSKKRETVESPSTTQASLPDIEVSLDDSAEESKSKTSFSTRRGVSSSVTEEDSQAKSGPVGAGGEIVSDTFAEIQPHSEDEIESQGSKSRGSVEHSVSSKKAPSVDEDNTKPDYSEPVLIVHDPKDGTLSTAYHIYKNRHNDEEKIDYYPSNDKAGNPMFDTSNRYAKEYLIEKFGENLEFVYSKKRVAEINDHYKQVSWSNAIIFNLTTKILSEIDQKYQSLPEEGDKDSKDFLKSQFDRIALIISDEQRKKLCNSSTIKSEELITSINAKDINRLNPKGIQNYIISHSIKLQKEIDSNCKETIEDLKKNIIDKILVKSNAKTLTKEQETDFIRDYGNIKFDPDTLDSYARKLYQTITDNEFASAVGARHESKDSIQDQLGSSKFMSPKKHLRNRLKEILQEIKDIENIKRISDGVGVEVSVTEEVKKSSVDTASQPVTPDKVRKSGEATPEVTPKESVATDPISISDQLPKEEPTQVSTPRGQTGCFPCLISPKKKRPLDSQVEVKNSSQSSSKNEVEAGAKASSKDASEESKAKDLKESTPSSSPLTTISQEDLKKLLSDNPDLKKDLLARHKASQLSSSSVAKESTGR